MSESTSRSVAEWLAQGLAHRAAGEQARAIEAWQNIMELDPSHEAARSYLAEAGVAVATTSPPGDEAEVLEETPGLQPEELREEALEMLSGGLVDDAYQLLTSTPGPDGTEPETIALVELLRTHLVDDVLMQVGSPTAVPVVEMASEDLMKINLPSGAGFLLSRIDGHTQVEDLVALSGMDPFETYHTLGRLLEAGIVGVVE
ncbi:MAG: hypothetical protein JRH01_14065 [Deltaproteobacteria bacterium]|nr:hypothetical protein [Deltaproteobacteria bacterium]MBW2394794.1 hypothetical protein [Deltaproteobacteria bacterium]